MKGAKEFASLFETGQYERLYIVSSEHARGKFFYIFVLPEGEKAISNGKSNAPLNKDAVKVYGVVAGNPGWTESYGWLHKGKWQDDFYRLVQSRKLEMDEQDRQKTADSIEHHESEQRRIKSLLDSY